MIRVKGGFGAIRKEFAVVADFDVEARWERIPMPVPASLRTALTEVTKVSGRSSSVGKFAKSLQPLLQAAVEELSEGSVSRPSRRGIGQISYVVEATRQGEVLTENREGGSSKPFRCPQTVYEALAAVLAGAGRPLGLDEIVAAVEKVLGDRPADHQVRVALRLWMHVEPVLVSRNRARYRSVELTTLPQAALHLWDQLRKRITK